MKCFWHFYCCLFTVVVVAHFGTLQEKKKEEKKKIKNVEKMWGGGKKALSCDRACWMDVEKRIRTNERKELLKKVISNYKWIHKLSSCCLQCQNWPRESSLEQTPALLWGGEGVCADGLSTDTGGIQDNVSVFQHATTILLYFFLFFFANLFCLLVVWRPTEEKKKIPQEKLCSQKQSALWFCHHCYICLVSLIFFFLY